MARVCVEFDCNGDDNGNGGRGVLSYSATLGDGVTDVFNVNHNLGTSDVFYSLRNLLTGELDAFDVALNSSNPNMTVLTFATPPAPNSVRVTVMAPAPNAL
jgi:hypothetical protein